jgi:hypothetical protein
MKRYLLYILILIAAALGGKHVYKHHIKPRFVNKQINFQHNPFSSKYPFSPDKPTLRVRTINFDAVYTPEEVEISMLHEVIREKYNVLYVDKDYDLVINGYLNHIPVPTDPKVIKIHYTSEVYVGDAKNHLDTHDLVLGFDFVDRDNYIRIPFSYIRHGNKMNHDFDRNKGTCDPKGKKYFTCFLASNSGDWSKVFDGAEARNRLFHKLSLYKKVESGGKHLNNTGGPIPYGQTEQWLSQCKFTIAYENQLNYPGYVTEKPFQAWFAGSIPLYNAHPEGLVDMNKKAVIYAGDFDSEDALVEYIKKVDNDDKLYCDIWNERIQPDSDKDYEVLKDKLRTKLNELFAAKLRKELL